MLSATKTEKNQHDNPDNDEERRKLSEMKILHEDSFIIIVDKPAGILSVPGKNGGISVCDFLEAGHGKIYPVHRLDMATSGILILAKDIDTYRKLQQDFESRSVKKRYLAILDGTVSPEKISSLHGNVINIPLSPDMTDRPRQKADYADGKEAVTFFRIMLSEKGKTLVEFHPVTGRTHQLRIHSAHPDGLGVAIEGDELYGRKSRRLMLHAASVTFTHPATGKKMTINAEPEGFGEIYMKMK